MTQIFGNSELTLGQKSELVIQIQLDTHLIKHFEVEDSEEVWKVVENFTDGMRRSFYQYLASKRYFKLNGLLRKQGLKDKINN